MAPTSPVSAHASRPSARPPAVRCWACLELKPVVRVDLGGMVTCGDCLDHRELLSVPGTSVQIEIVG